MTMVSEPCMHLLSVRCVLTIFSRFRWLKASELMLFFFNFKAGFYERFYGYFDTQTIIRSVKTFIEERTLAIAAYERNM